MAGVEQLLHSNRDCFARAIAFIFSAASAVRFNYELAFSASAASRDPPFLYFGGHTCRTTPGMEMEMDALNLAEAWLIGSCPCLGASWPRALGSRNDRWRSSKSADGAKHVQRAER
jgi:hypothetical protein